MSDSSAPPPRRLRAAVASFAGAAVGVAAFAAGWWLLAGAAPSLVGWSVGGVAAAFLGSEVAAHATTRFAGCGIPSGPPIPPPPVLTPGEPGGSSVESTWRDRVRDHSTPHLGGRR